MKILRQIYHRLRNVKLERLKRNGLIVGKRLNLQPGVIIDSHHCWLISIGDDVTIAPRAVILAHDASTKHSLGFTKVSTVKIGNRVFIGANSVILPGVSVGDDVVIGAGSVVSRDIPPNAVVAGNPARILYSYSDYQQKSRELMAKSPIFSEDFTVRRGINRHQKQTMLEKISEAGLGYVE